jgi:hypothetical protein
VLYRDGVPMASLVAGDVTFFEEFEPATQWQVRQALLRGAEHAPLLAPASAPLSTGKRPLLRVRRPHRRRLNTPQTAATSGGTVCGSLSAQAADSWRKRISGLARSLWQATHRGKNPPISVHRQGLLCHGTLDYSVTSASRLKELKRRSWVLADL